MNVTSPLFGFDGSFNMTAWLDNVTLSGGSFVKYDLNAFRRLSLSTLLSDGLNVAFPTSAFHLLHSTETLENLGVNLSSLLQSNVFNSTHVTFTTNNHEDVPAAAESMVSWALTTAEDMMNAVVKAVLRNNSTGSESSTNEPIDYSTVLFTSLAIASAAFVVVNGLILCMRLCSRRQASSNSDLVEPLLSDAHYLSESSLVEEDRVVIADNTVERLFLHEAVPMHVRHFYPVIITGALFLLLASNLSVGASVDLVVSSDSGKTLSLPSLFAFSLANTATEMYNAGIFSLLFLVVGFSGVWPYTKLLLMLFGWCTRVLDLRQRGCMLFLLDALGKFSLVDSFVLVLMMVSFRLHLVVEGLMTLDVFVNPGFGFYSFLLATSVSLIAGHVILYFHRQSLVHVKSSDETRESLCRHEFDDHKSGTKRRMTCFSAVFIVAIILLTVVLLSIGMTQKSFIFQVGGLVGKMLGDDRTKSYSLLTLGTSLPQSAEEASFGLVCLEMAYFFYLVVMPFSCLVALAALFTWPMTYTWQTRILVLAEICNAWSAVEVFALSILASLMELPTFAAFIVGDKCDFIKALNLLDDGDDDSCYTVTCSVASSVWFLICGAVLNSWIVSFTLKVAHHAMSEQRQRLEESEEDKNALLTLSHDDTNTHDLVSILMHSILGGLLFCKPENHDEERDHARRKSHGTTEFWKEWQEMCSVT